MNNIARIIKSKHARSIARPFIHPTQNVVFQVNSLTSFETRSHDNIYYNPGQSIRCKSTEIPKHAVDSSEGNAKIEPKYPVLNHVKKLPIVGSILPQLSGVQESIMDPYKYWPKMRELYGDFYSCGMPAFGSEDWCGTIYVVTDPKEMVKVVRAGGAYPSGIVEGLWATIKWFESRDMLSVALFRRGKEWKRMRNFMQKDFMHPEAARGYVPGMIQAAKVASQGAPAMNKDLNTYLGLCAFDMFSAIMFGELTKTADPAASKAPENVKFVKNAMVGLGTSVEMLFHPYETIMVNLLGFETTKQKRAFEGLDNAWEIAEKKIEAFAERKKLGQLNENEEVSYLSRALDRQKEDEGDITLREAKEVSFTGLFAAVDTTSSVIGWNLFNVSRIPKIQEKLYKELSHAVATIGGGELTTDVLDRKNVPYLHAVIRETQRLTPPDAFYTSKQLAESVEVNGVQLNAGDVVALEGYSLGIDPKLVDNPRSFEPERWLPDAVEARKGTHKEIMDHPFLKEPFSQGARRCPGSRVAANEVQVLLAQLVLDWKMTSPISSLDDAKFSQKTTLEVELPEIKFEPRV